MHVVTIELRVDDTEKDRVEIVNKAARQAAKHLFTTASLIAGRRAPQIMLTVGDNFTDAQEIMLEDDMPQGE